MSPTTRRTTQQPARELPNSALLLIAGTIGIILAIVLQQIGLPMLLPILVAVMVVGAKWRPVELTGVNKHDKTIPEPATDQQARDHQQWMFWSNVSRGVRDVSTVRPHRNATTVAAILAAGVAACQPAAWWPVRPVNALIGYLLVQSWMVARRHTDPTLPRPDMRLDVWAGPVKLLAAVLRTHIRWGLWMVVSLPARIRSGRHLDENSAPVVARYASAAMDAVAARTDMAAHWSMWVADRGLRRLALILAAAMAGGILGFGAAIGCALAGTNPTIIRVRGMLLTRTRMHQPNLTHPAHVPGWWWAAGIVATFAWAGACWRWHAPAMRTWAELVAGRRDWKKVWDDNPKLPTPTLVRITRHQLDDEQHTETAVEYLFDTGGRSNAADYIPAVADLARLRGVTAIRVLVPVEAVNPDDGQPMAGVADTTQFRLVEWVGGTYPDLSQTPSEATMPIWRLALECAVAKLQLSVDAARPVTLNQMQKVTASDTAGDAACWVVNLHNISDPEQMRTLVVEQVAATLGCDHRFSANIGGGVMFLGDMAADSLDVDLFPQLNKASAKTAAQIVDPARHQVDTATRLADAAAVWQQRRGELEQQISGLEGQLRHLNDVNDTNYDPLRLPQIDTLQQELGEVRAVLDAETRKATVAGVADAPSVEDAVEGLARARADAGRAVLENLRLDMWWMGVWSEALKGNPNTPSVRHDYTFAHQLGNGVTVHDQTFMGRKSTNPLGEYATGKFEAGLRSAFDPAATMACVVGFRSDPSRPDRHAQAFRLLWSNQQIPRLSALAPTPDNGGPMVVIAAAFATAFEAARMPRPEVLRATCLTGGGGRAGLGARRGSGQLWEVELHLYDGLTAGAIRRQESSLRSSLQVEFLQVVGRDDAITCTIAAGANPNKVNLSDEDRRKVTGWRWEQLWKDAGVVGSDQRLPVLVDASTMPRNDLVQVLRFVPPPGRGLDSMRGARKKVMSQAGLGFFEVNASPKRPGEVTVMCAEVSPIPQVAPYDFDFRAEPGTYPIGTGIDGEPVVVNPRKLAHLAVFGTTGGGKSTTANALLAGQLNAGFKTIICDPQKFAADFVWAKQFCFGWATTLEDTYATLSAVHAEMRRRATLNGEYGATSIHELPAEVRPDVWYLYLDEFKGLITVPDKPSSMPESDPELEAKRQADVAAFTMKKKIGWLVGRIYAEGRSAGVHAVLMTQKLTADALTKDLRDVKTNANKLLMGRASNGDRAAALREPYSVPDLGDEVPPGRGLWETASATAVPIQVWYAEADEYARVLSSRLPAQVEQLDVEAFRPSASEFADFVVSDDVAVSDAGVMVSDAVDLGELDLGEVDLGELDLSDAVDLGELDLSDAVDLGELDLGELDLSDAIGASEPDVNSHESAPVSEPAPVFKSTPPEPADDLWDDDDLDEDDDTSSDDTVEHGNEPVDTDLPTDAGTSDTETADDDEGEQQVMRRPRRPGRTRRSADNDDEQQQQGDDAPAAHTPATDLVDTDNPSGLVTPRTRNRAHRAPELTDPLANIRTRQRTRH